METGLDAAHGSALEAVRTAPLCYELLAPQNAEEGTDRRGVTNAVCSFVRRIVVLVAPVWLITVPELRTLAADACCVIASKAFLSRVSILLLTRDIDIAILSVRLSVRLSVCP